MKRGLLIAGGTLGGLGVVMAITPPQLSSTSNLAVAGSSAMSGAVSTAASSAPAASAASTSATATATQSATNTTSTKRATSKAVATKKASVAKSATATAAGSSNSNSNSSAAATNPAPAATQTAAPAPTQTQAAKGVTGTFAGPAIFVNYGTVQVQITVKDGKITDATALQAPSGRNDRYTNMALPVLKKQTLAAQSDAIQGASGASYTSYGWFKSLQGALAKAGL